MGSDYTGSEAGQLFADNEAWISIVLIVVGCISLFFFFKFKKQRKFPANILGWLVISNMFYDIWLLAKWSDQDFQDTFKTDLPRCNFTVFMDYFHHSNTVVLNTLMTFTLFMLLRQNKEYEYATNPIYLWGYIAFEAIVPTTMGIIAAELGKAYQENQRDKTFYNCYATGEALVVFEVVLAIMVTAQLVFISLTLRSMYVVISSVKRTSQSKRDVRFTYLAVRCILCFMSQIVSVGALYTASFSAESHSLNKALTNALLCNYAVGSLTDALILLFGNQSLWKWTAAKLNKRETSSGTTSSSDDSEKMVSMAHTPSTEHVPSINRSPSPENV